MSRPLLLDNIESRILRGGDKMTGALQLKGAPTSDLEAATKKYVDDNTPDTANAAKKLAQARNLAVSDNDGSNTGPATSFDGTANATMKLPATIKASLTGNASSASKLTTTSAGSSQKPVYFASGIPQECGSELAVSITGNAATATLANEATHAVNADNATNATEAAHAATADTATNATTAGTCTGNAATATRLASSTAVGSTTAPIYFSNGVPQPCGGTLAVAISGKAASADKLNTNAGSTTLPVYFDAGIPKACNTDLAVNVTGSSGSCTGNAATATTLKTSRNLSVSDNSGTNTGPTVSFNGSAAAVLKLPTTIKATLDGNATSANTATKANNGIFYVEGNTTGTEGVWTGTNTDISSLYVGLTIAYKIGIAGVSGGTTLNLTTAAGAAGAIGVYRNNSVVTTHYSVGTVLTLTYDGTYWRCYDYSVSNTDTKVRVYRQTTGYNADYPILVSRTTVANIATVGTDGSNEAVYAVIGQDGTYTPTVNPHTGQIKIKCNTASTSKTTGALIVTGGVGVSGNIYGNNVYGAVWNDYAEFRKSKELEPGRVICENGDGTLSRSTERMQAAPEVVSDTFGFAIGETDECKTPVAVSGRVLVYTYEPRDSYKAGDVVCAGPDGTVSKMTREEIKEYPDRMIGVVSEIPNYDTWGTGNVAVNGRIWIKVK